MTLANPESLTVDTVPLTTFARNIPKRGARMTVPPGRGNNPESPGRHGSLYVPNKRFGEGELTVPMWALGCNDDGSVAANQRLTVRNNIEEVLRLFYRRDRLVTLVQTLPDGSSRQCSAECVGAMDFNAQAGGTRAEFTVELRVPAAFWRDVTQFTWSSAAALTTGSGLVISYLDNATAPLDDAIVVVHGPATNPQIAAVGSGTYVWYEGTIASGTDWRVDCAEWTSRVGSGIGFAGAGTDAIATTWHGGGARFLEFQPQAVGASVGTFTGTALGANTRVEVRGYRKHLIG